LPPQFILAGLKVFRKTTVGLGVFLCHGQPVTM